MQYLVEINLSFTNGLLAANGCNYLDSRQKDTLSAYPLVKTSIRQRKTSDNTYISKFSISIFTIHSIAWPVMIFSVFFVIYTKKSN